MAAKGVFIAVSYFSLKPLYALKRLKKQGLFRTQTTRETDTNRADSLLLSARKLPTTPTSRTTQRKTDRIIIMTTSIIAPEHLDQFIDPVRDIAREAGRLISDYFDPAGLSDVDAKADGSPVTLADQRAEAFITPKLHELAPGVPVIAEEAAEAGELPDLTHGTFWLVDPLDGTKGFIKGSGDFTVNIALLIEYRPVLGVIIAPVLAEEYLGYGLGTAIERHGDQSAEDRPMTISDPAPTRLRVSASKNHNNPGKLDEFLAGHDIAECKARSSSLKFCEVAAGRSDIYPRFGPTCEWDTAAGQAILEAAGGLVTDLDGGPFVYGKVDEKFLNPGFIAWGGLAPDTWFAKTEAAL